ncbi:hypothetical protein GQ43DRAFT_409910 [Delitschia confertaspora ATCC 74209]|uniref:Kelch repeat protein n=1 Tax=Delitschia confertaspora ATCC 74209 TaxID=1513339 RepID=A0A9P4JRH4_9PLEO|nr:hypothetical protein GQ43DRAFT_409910 [Delitschia confertaspora ATCC 74209]
MSFKTVFASLQIVLALVSLLIPSATAQLPYIPTQVLWNDSRLYIFRPSASASSQFELGSIDINKRVESSALSFTTLHPSLPFLDPKNRRAFTPILDDDGNITVYTGECGKGASGAEVWTFVPEVLEAHGNGSWKQEEVSLSSSEGYPTNIGPNYLNGGISFSSLTNANALNTEAYFFGGMCPTYDSADGQASSNYSNTMVILEPAKSETRAVNYRLSVSSSRGPPVAEAGFTLTGLQPTYLNKSDGTQTQKRDYVLIGGHTQNAFINMSQIALFSLPQQTWTFLPVKQPDISRTDLGIRGDISEIESRSGHTAVLTPDGQRIVIFGGWVGDVNTPADPQLAILNVGEDYGGQGSWEWTAPSTSGLDLPDNTGIYGHGAVMLPGGVMMVIGGYSVGGSSSRRRQNGVGNSRTLFFNTTSNTWVTEYVPPLKATSAEPAKEGPLSKNSQKAGLGAGLGVGAAAVIGLFAFYVCYTRRLRKQREIREKQLQGLALDARQYNLPPGMNGRGGHLDAEDYFDDPRDTYYFNPGMQQQNQGWRRANGQEAERTGLLVEIPSPTRGLRRSLNGRANPHIQGQRNRGSGYIHPIDELEEEEHDIGHKPEMTEVTNHSSPFSNAPVLHPSHNSVIQNSPPPHLNLRSISPLSNSQTLEGWDSPEPRTRSFTSSRGTRPNTANGLGEADSFITAKTSFMQLQAEGEALLGGTFEPYHDNHPSPTRPPIISRLSYPPVSGSLPRRAVSDASLWRSKRGKKDWLDDHIDPEAERERWRKEQDDWGAPEDRVSFDTRRSTDTGGLGSEDEDWDVEAAVERRVVQVMFTVPRTRLRVVNADADRSSLLSVENARDSKERNNEGKGEKEKEKSTPLLEERDTSIDKMEERDEGENMEKSPVLTLSTGGPGKVKELVSMFQSQEELVRASPASSIKSPSMSLRVVKK